MRSAEQEWSLATMVRNLALSVLVQNVVRMLVRLSTNEAECEHRYLRIATRSVWLVFGAMYALYTVPKTAICSSNKLFQHSEQNNHRSTERPQSVAGGYPFIY